MPYWQHDDDSYPSSSNTQFTVLMKYSSPRAIRVSTAGFGFLDAGYTLFSKTLDQFTTLPIPIQTIGNRPDLMRRSIRRLFRKDVKEKKDLLGAYTRYATTGEWKVPKRKTPVSNGKGKVESKSKENPPEPKTPFNLGGNDYDFLIARGNNYDENTPPWTYIYDDISHEIQITVHMEHPIFRHARKGGEKILTKIAQIDVFCQMMQDKGYSIAEVQIKRENLYRECFGGSK